jgi:DNA-binding NtrC family response regulator
MSLSNRVVLVVDDDPDIGWALDKLLGKLGARCILAFDGQTALEVVQLQHVCLTLVDAKLPDIDGLDLAATIRSTHPGIPVILVSGYFYQDDAVIQAAFQQGLICGFVEKPFSHAGIIGAMEAALYPRESGPEQ